MGKTRNHRRHRSIYINQYPFHTRKIVDNVRYLRCSFHKKHNCKASAKMLVNGSEKSAILINAEHNHSIDKPNVLRMLIRKELKKRIAQGSKSYKAVYDEVAKKFPSALKLCPYQSVKKSLFRWSLSSRFNSKVKQRAIRNYRERKKIESKSPKILNQFLPHNYNSNNCKSYDMSLCPLTSETIIESPKSKETETDEISIPTFTINGDKVLENGKDGSTEQEEEFIGETVVARIQNEKEVEGKERSRTNKERNESIYGILINLRRKMYSLESSVNSLSTQLSKDRLARISLQNIVDKYFIES